jgi:lipoprotein NlpI
MRTLLLLALLTPVSLRADEFDDAIALARDALKRQNAEQVIKAARVAITSRPKSPEGYFYRGEGHGLQRQSKEAVADFDKAIELDPNFALAYDRRGGEQFKLGNIKESIDDFDAFIKMRPKAEENHWRRGISYYYAGKFADGAKQFKLGEKVYDNDVENAFWHYLCNARDVGVEKARKDLLKIGTDTRVPFMKIYDLIQGKAKPEEVLAAAEKANLDKEDKNEAMFYAHLYVGLNYEAEGKKDKAIEVIGKGVANHKISHYMWDVGNVHLLLLKKEKE